MVRTVDAGTLPDSSPATRPPLVDIMALRRRIAALHDELPERTRGVEELLASAKAGTERSTALRARVAADRDHRQSG